MADSNERAVVVDEQYGRDAADAEGIATRGTAYLLLSLAKEEEITAETARETIDAMIDAGWYCEPNTYATLLQKLESIG